MRISVVGVIAGVLLSGLITSATFDATPDFSGFWQHGARGQQYRNPASGPGPIRRVGVLEDASFTANWFGDDRNPILQPWTAEAVRIQRERESKGLADASAFTTCRPMGVPFILTYVRPIQFLQTPDRVYIVLRKAHLHTGLIAACLLAGAAGKGSDERRAPLREDSLDGPPEARPIGQ